jgi:signal transduction histidine kinase
LVLTADATTDTKQRALSVGASDFITKPFDLIEVGLRIRNLLLSCHLMHQLENQNQILEDKVKERTAELENTNVDLLAALDKAEESDRLKTAFLLTISHEIRTPLNGILGFASLLAEQELPQDEKLEYVNVMHSSGDRLINTINDYVDMALIVSGNQDVKFELVNINKLLHEQVDKFKQRCENKGLRLILSIPEDQEKVTVQSDLELLRKIISHLLDNAIKFTKRGEINIGLSKKPGFIEFLVKDTGVGIEETAKERVFNIFMQGNNTITRSFEGSGLGLSIIRELLKLLGGEIRMESVEGEGTTFYFTLPLETRVV